MRPAGAADLECLVELMSELYRESGYAFDRDAAARAFAMLIGDEALGRIWLAESLAESDAQPIGYVVLTLGFSLEYLGRDAFIDDLFVRAPARGSGLGTRLMQIAEAEAIRLGVRALHLEVERANPQACALYRRRGFSDNDRQLMSKRLTSG